MGFIRKRLFILTIFVSTVFFTGATAHAAIDNMLQDMFDNFTSTSTSAGAYEGQSRGYLTGGGITMKSPTNSYQLFTFNPPSYSAGCGGIDLFGGSFSYINSDKLEQLVTNIGSNALGYVVQLAIETLCQQCSSVLKSMDKIARDINSLNINSCNTAKSLVNSTNLPGALSSFAETVGLSSASSGNTDDAADSKDTMSTSTGLSSLVSSMSSTLEANEEQPWGNIVYDALNNGGSFTSDDINLIMSMTGTIIVDKEGKLSIYPPIIDADAYLNGGSSIQHYECNETDSGHCLGITVTTSDFEGLRTKVYSNVSSIASKITNRTALSGTEENFINLLPVPAKSMLDGANDSSGYVRSLLVNYTSDSIASLLASIQINYVETQLKLAMASFISKNVPVDLKEAHKLANDMRDTNQKLLTKINSNITHIEEIKNIATGFDTVYQSNQAAKVQEKENK